MSKKAKLYLIPDIVTVVAQFVDKFAYPNCCLVNKLWYNMFKKFNKSFSYYYICLYNPPGGAPRTDYFVCNTLEEVSIALKEEIITGVGFWFFTFQDTMTLTKVLNDGKEIKLDLYDYITVEYPEKFGNLPIRFNKLEAYKDCPSIEFRALNTEGTPWTEDDKKRLSTFLDDLFGVDDWEKDIYRKKIKVIVDMEGIVKKFGGKYIGSLKNTYDVRKEKYVNICVGEWDDNEITQVNIDREDLIYGKMIHTNI